MVLAGPLLDGGRTGLGTQGRPQAGSGAKRLSEEENKDFLSSYSQGGANSESTGAQRRSRSERGTRHEVTQKLGLQEWLRSGCEENVTGRVTKLNVTGTHGGFRPEPSLHVCKRLQTTHQEHRLCPQSTWSHTRHRRWPRL